MWRAYGLLNMTDLNRYIVDSYNNLVNSYRLADGSLNEITNCTVNGLDAGYEFYPGFVIGARLGQMRVSQGKLSGIINSNPKTGRTGPFAITFDSTLVPYMVGGSLRLAEGNRFSFAFAVYLGYALATAKFDFSDSLGAFGLSGDMPLQGSGVCDDVSGEVRYKLSDALALGADVHLMNARISSMTLTKDVPEAGLAAGSTFRDQRHSVLSFDYGTIAAGIGLYFSF